MKNYYTLYLAPIFLFMGMGTIDAQVRLDKSGSTTASDLIQQLKSPQKVKRQSVQASNQEMQSDEFNFREVDNNLPPELKKKYPGIKMYRGTATGNAKKTAVITVAGDDLSGYVLESGDVTQQFMNRGGSDLIEFSDSGKPASQCALCTEDTHSCLHTEPAEPGNTDNNLPQRAKSLQKSNAAFETYGSYSHGTNYRTFRYAMILSYWQMQSFGYTTVEQGLAAVNTKVTSLNDVFGKEVAAKFTLIPNEDQLIFLTSSDPYPESTYGENGMDSWPINKTVLNDKIGDSNYDWAMLIHPTNKGWAVPGMCGYKHQGMTSNDLNLFLHEMGHMFGGLHSYLYEGSVNVSAKTRGIVGSNGGVWFHASNWEIAAKNMDNWSCGTTAPSGNTPPTITSYTPSGLYIPKATPFVLSGQATDPDASASISYCWQHMNVTDISSANSTDPGQLMWTWWAPSATANLQYVPSLQSLIDNTGDPYSYQPNASTEVKARLLVRDNQVPYGGGAYQDITFNIDASAGPFVLTYPNSALSFTGGQNLTVTWDVANTTNALVNAQLVNILISTDQALTWTTLASNVANNGSYTVTLPDLSSSKCRIKVEAAGNMFFDISNVDFSIVASTTNDFSYTKIVDSQSVFNETTATYQFNMTKLGIFSHNVGISYSGVPSGATMVATSPLTNSGDFSVQLTNANAVAPGKYTITVKLTEVGGTGINKSQTITFIKKKLGDGTANKSIFAKLNKDYYMGAKATITDITTNNFSMSIWFKPVATQPTSTSSPAYVAYPSNQAYNDPVLALGYNASINVNDAGIAGFSLKNSGSVKSGVAVTREAWNHLALTVSPTQVVLYLNGNPISVNNRRVLPIALGTTLWVCRGADWFKQNSGEYDEVKIFNKTLSATEVQETMHRNDDYDNPSLLHYFQFNETSNNAACISPVSFASCAFEDNSGVLTSRITATEPTGTAVVATVAKSDALTPMGSTGVSLQFASANATETSTVHKIGLDPYMPESTGIDASYTALHAGSYWEINAYPQSVSNPISMAKFTVAYDVQPSDLPANFKLYTRGQNAIGAWSLVGSGTAIDALNNTISFSNLPQNGQYLIYKAPDVSTGIDSENTGNTVKAYPNPVKAGEMLSISGISGKCTVVLYDIVGRIAMKTVLNDSKFNIPTQLNTGHYILDILQADQKNTRVNLIVK